MSVIEQNTVAATEQVQDMDNMRIVRRGGSKKILFIGNSITRHRPKPDIGWEHDWGMAASAIDKDYVHQTVALLEKVWGPVDFAFTNCSDWERAYFEKEKLTKHVAALEFAPDIVVIRIGENIWSRAVRHHLDEVELYPHFDDMVKFFANGRARVVMTDLFWPQERIDAVIRRVAAENGYSLVSIGDLGKADENMAIGEFEHHGVSIHPNDVGMHRIAERIAAALLT